MDHSSARAQATARRHGVEISGLKARQVTQADFRRFTIRIQPGIFFADDPAFAGRRRELVAQDYVYSYKRFADPATTSPGWSSPASPTCSC